MKLNITSINTALFIKLDELKTLNPSDTLFVLGNGFDLMHGVLSRYTDFRDSMSPHSQLREILEMYIASPMLWKDFEESLAHINAMAIHESANAFLDIFDAYDEDAQAADFFAAIDAASTPIHIIENELPTKFRKWVNSLRLPSDNKVLEGIIKHNSKFLVFNYTEFIQTLYGVMKENVCYIHGCRKNVNENLILGHSPDWQSEEDFIEYLPPENVTNLQMNYDAWQHVSYQLSDYNASTEKNTSNIIKSNKEFFISLSEIKNVVIIGHSLSKVDYAYFCQIKTCNSYPSNINWYISYHSNDDLHRIRGFVKCMDLYSNNIVLFKI